MKNIQLATRINKLEESATLALNARAKQMAADGQTVYNLTAGELATDTPNYIRSAVSKNLYLNKYTPVAGLAKLREQIAVEACAFYRLDWVKPQNVVVTAGAKPALFSSLQVTLNPGDEVIVPVPAWTTSYKPLIELAGGKMVEVRLTKEYDLDPKTIASAITKKTKAIIINSPNNPTGAVFSANALLKLVGLLRGTNVVVIADDIYSKLVYQDDFTAVGSYDFEQIIIINGFSKSQALTGWRIGYLIANTSVVQAVTKLLSHVNGNASLPAQMAAISALSRHDKPPKSTVDALIHQRQMVVEALSNIPEVKYKAPGGAFYVLLDLRNLTDNAQSWCERLLVEAGVALVPGEAFSAPGFARLTFVCDEKTLQTALVKIQEFVKKESKL